MSIKVTVIRYIRQWVISVMLRFSSNHTSVFSFKPSRTTHASKNTLQLITNRLI